MKYQLLVDKGKVRKKAVMITLENWDFPVLIDEKKYCKMSWWSNSKNYQFLINGLEIDTEQKGPLFPIPVINQKIKIK